MLLGMNWEQAKSLLIKFLGMAGAFLAGTSWGQGFLVTHWELISGVVIATASMIWTLKANTQTSLVEAAASMPMVNKVVINDAQVASEITKPGAVVTTS